MSLEEIKDLKIPSEDNSILFLWATAPKLQDAFEVIKAWGFRYKSCAVWDKEIIGMGYWFRGQHELLLVGTKGKVKPPNASQRISSILREPRGRHSAKPDFVKYLISDWYPQATKLEMFARKNTPNLFQQDTVQWEVFGNQVTNSIEIS